MNCARSRTKQQCSYNCLWGRTDMMDTVRFKNAYLSSSSSSSDVSLKHKFFQSIIVKKLHETYNNNPVMEYRFFFFFFDFFFSRWGDEEGLSELLKEGMKASDLFFMVRTILALMFIFSPVSVLVFLFLLPTTLLGRRTWIIWIFHQPERTKAADLESGTGIMLGDEWKYYTVLSNLKKYMISIH